ncbi:MAG: hypothetical protein ACI4JK_02130 [Oscillospiraceae bacterium]
MKMPRYINLDELLTAIDRRNGRLPLWLDEILMEDCKVSDVVPVRHGKWVKEKKDVLIHWHCSACRECYFLEEPNAKYCPNCGAKMDGAKND